MDSISPSSDRDPQETSEWIESVESVVTHEGRERARYLLARVLERSGHLGVEPSLPLHTDYVNTVRVEDEQFTGTVRRSRSWRGTEAPERIALEQRDMGVAVGGVTAGKFYLAVRMTLYAAPTVYG